MKKIYIIINIIIVSCTLGCTNDISNNNVEKDKLKIIKDNFWNLKNSDILIAEDVGKYANLYTQTDFCAIISAQKSDPLLDVFYSSYNGTVNNYGELQNKKIKTFSVSANGMTLKTNDDTKTFSEKEDLSSLYGKNVKFYIGQVNRTASSNSGDDTIVDIYVPELIEITSPAIITKDDLYPLCYYEDFLLEWNADENNENGVVVMITWTGATAFGQNHPNICIRRTDIVPDNGSAILDSHLFDDIPDTGIVHLSIARGSVEDYGIDNEKYIYKITAETHATLPLILIRNIKKI